MNLAANARDAMPEGGRLTIATANEDVSAERRAGSAGDRRPGDTSALRSPTRATAFPKTCCAQIFEPFFTTKEQGKGTGLGSGDRLRHREAERRLDLRASSELGEGTTFTHLPAAVVPSR